MTDAPLFPTLPVSLPVSLTGALMNALLLYLALGVCVGVRRLGHAARGGGPLEHAGTGPLITALISLCALHALAWPLLIHRPARKKNRRARAARSRSPLRKKTLKKSPLRRETLRKETLTRSGRSVKPGRAAGTRRKKA